MKRIVKSIKFPENLVEQIEQYRRENNIVTFTAALFELIRKGLSK